MIIREKVLRLLSMYCLREGIFDLFGCKNRIDLLKWLEKNKDALTARIIKEAVRR